MQDDQPVAWATYVSVEDADATLAKARDAGGTVIVDADGGDGTWARWRSSATRPGPSSASGSPAPSSAPRSSTREGAFSWNELGHPRRRRLDRFYGKVFGWDGRGARHGGDGDVPASGRTAKVSAAAPRHVRRHPRRGHRTTGSSTSRSARRRGGDAKAAGGNLSNGPIDIRWATSSSSPTPPAPSSRCWPLPRVAKQRTLGAGSFNSAP